MDDAPQAPIPGMGGRLGRRLGHWVGGIRRGFLAGLRGAEPMTTSDDSVTTPADGVGRRVIVRRTTIEELEIHEPGPDGR